MPIAPVDLDPRAHEILRLFFTVDIDHFYYTTGDTRWATQQWTQAHGLPSVHNTVQGPMDHLAFEPLLAWSYAQTWANQIDESTLLQKWCHFMSQGRTRDLTWTAALQFSKQAQALLEHMPESKKINFATVSFDTLRPVLAVYVENNHTLGDDTSEQHIKDVCSITVGLGALASLSPKSLTSGDQIPLDAAWLEMVYDIWGLVRNSNVDLRALDYFLNSSLPETFKRTALLGMSGYTWVSAAPSCGSQMLALLPQTETERAQLIPWRELNGFCDTHPVQQVLRREVQTNIQLAKTFCPQLHVHMEMLDSDELWVSKGFLCSTAKMLEPGANIAILDLPQDYDHAPEW